jgi:glycosyltransferase involved in cell wall biosynthesis
VPSSQTASSGSIHKSGPPIDLFLMTNTFETGGSERQFAVLANHIDRKRFHVHLGCIRRDGPFAADFGDVPEFRLGGSLFGLQSWNARLRLRRHLRQNHAQIAHAFDFYTNLTLVPAARMARVPVVIGSHRQLGDLLTAAQFRAQAAAFRWCDAVACNSRAAAASLKNAGIANDKLHVIGNALPEAVFAAAEPALPKKPGGLRIGMVARMNARYKNHSSFLRIAARIRQSMPNVDFLLVGDGPLRAEIEKEAEKAGLADSVKFLGDRRDIPAVLASMDIAVLTSDSESLSNVILEAMAAGLPVVAFDAGGNSELVNGERGALVPPGNEERFAAALQALLSSATRRQELGANARKFVLENFSLDRVRSRYEELYQGLYERKLLRKARHR